MLAPEPTLRRPRSPRSLARSAVFLIIAFGGLVVFIMGLGDLRRQRNALAQAKWHAGIYQRRVGEGGALPLNLEPERPPQGASQMIALEFLDRDAARSLRDSGEPVLAAWSVPVLQVLRQDGRAVVLFRNGRFEVRWAPLKHFETMRSAQSQRMVVP